MPNKQGWVGGRAVVAEFLGLLSWRYEFLEVYEHVFECTLLLGQQ